MKKKLFLLTLFLSLLSIYAISQEKKDTLLYLRFPTVPSFNLIKIPDSTLFTKAGLHKKKATIVMLFSPDCDHCQHETNELKKNIELFKKVQIIMASPLEYKYIKKFYDDYQLGDYDNIIVGRDPGFMLGTFYKIKSYPAIFLYNKNGKFVKAFDGTVPIQKIAAEL